MALEILVPEVDVDAHLAVPGCQWYVEVEHVLVRCYVGRASVEVVRFGLPLVLYGVGGVP